MPLQVKKGSINNNDPITSNNVEIDYDKMARANAAAMSNVKVASAPFNSWNSRSQMSTEGININQIKNQKAV